MKTKRFDHLRMPTDPADAAALAAALVGRSTARYGNARMEDKPDDKSGGDDGEKGKEDSEKGKDGDKGKEDGPPKDFVDPDTGEKYGFPEKTPTADMTAEQKAEYWRHKARKHEAASKQRSDYDAIKAERDQLRNSSLTKEEREAQDAVDAAVAAARKEERLKGAHVLVRTKLDDALERRGYSNEQSSAMLDPVDLSRFIDDEGEVLTAKVATYVESFGKEKDGRWPDMGQGKRGKTGGKPSVSGSKDEYLEKRRKSLKKD